MTSRLGFRNLEYLEAYTMSSLNILLAGSYSSGFMEHWKQVFSKQSSIVLLALGVGAVGIFIITRAKWKK